MIQKFAFLLVLTLLLSACGGAAATTPEVTPVEVTPLPADTVASPTTEPTVAPEPTEPPTAPPSSETPLPELSQRMDEFVSKLTESGRFSGAVLVARGDEIIFSQGYGLADREKEIANTPQTKFRVTSLTKMLTAAAIMQLQEQGKLKVTDAICDHLSDCPAAWEAVTIHQLLTHTSGMPDYRSRLDRTKPVSSADVVAAVRDVPLAFEPGSLSDYNNTGYVLLGSIIESGSGQTYATYIQESILDPLGMTNSGFDEQTDGLAVGYQFDQPVDIDVSIPSADGSLYSTIEDMYRLGRAFTNNQLLTDESLQAMFTPLAPGGWSAGYGIIIGSLHGRPAWGSGGSTTAIDGYAADFVVYPEDDLIYVVLSNDQSTVTDPIGETLSKWVFESE